MTQARNQTTSSPIHTVDVAHPPLPAAETEAILLQSWSEVRNSPTLRLMKIIHGYGSSGKGGSTREVVRLWGFRNRKKFRDIIDGESYNPYHAQVQEIRKELGLFEDQDLWTPNPGITIFWVK